MISKENQNLHDSSTDRVKQSNILKRELIEATRVKSALRIGKAVDQLRSYGFTYKMCFETASSSNPSLTEEDWEEFMQEADEIESKS